MVKKEQFNIGEWTPERVSKVLVSINEMEDRNAIMEPIEVNRFLNKEIEKEESFWGDGLVMPRATTFITGSAKIGKSTFALNLALSLATGKEFLDFDIPKSRRVLLLQQEISEFNLQKRLKRMSQGLKIPYDKFFCHTCSLKMDDASDRDKLKNYIKQIKPEIVILDPMYKFFLTLDENSSKDIKLLLDELDKLCAEFGVALVIIHHHKKSNGNEKYSPGMIRGSSTLFDYGSSYIILNKVDNYSRQLRVDFELRNAESPSTVFMKMNEYLWFEVGGGS